MTSETRPLPEDIQRLVPTHKDDLAAVERLADAVRQQGFRPRLHALIPDLLHWVADMHWPVAQPIATILSGLDVALVGHIRAVLLGTDDGWKHSILQLVVRNSPRAIQEALAAELESLARARDPEDAWEVALEIVDSLRNTPDLAP